MSATGSIPSVRSLVQEMVEAARERKARDLKVLRLSEVSDFTDYFLIASGNTERQVRAIGRAVEERLKEFDVRPLHVEEGWWTLLDYGDFVFHVFTEQQRRYYALEQLWSDAPEVGTDLTDDAGA